MHQGIAFRTAYVFTGVAEDAQEAAQDAFVKASSSARALPGGGAVPAVALEDRGERGPEPPPRGGEEGGARRACRGERRREDAAPSPESALLSAERREELMAALNRLRSKDREVIACRYFLDLSEEDMAAALGWKRGTVKSRLSRALERLRAELEVQVA